MKKQVTIYTQAIKWLIFSDTFEIEHNTVKRQPSKDLVVVDICEQDIEIELPDNIESMNFDDEEVEQLQKQKEELNAEHHMRVKALDEKIASLQSIGYTGE